MFYIKKQNKNGNIQPKVLASGKTKDEAWNNFNQRKVYSFYNENTKFVCENSLDIS